MKDPEVGRVQIVRGLRLRPSSQASEFSFKKPLAIITYALAFVSVVFGIGLVASHCERFLNDAKEIVVLEKSSFGMTKQLDRRELDCLNETETSGTRILSDGSIAIVTQHAAEPDVTSVVSVPISTRTHTQTIYSMSTIPEHTVTKTTTSLVVASESALCSPPQATVTITYTVVPTGSWLSSSVLGDITVTAGGSTVTRFNTDVSYTTDLPDVTVTARPSTLTDVETDVSHLPDVTVTGRPSTLTDVQTDVSLTTELPDATVSGLPFTVTDVLTKTSVVFPLTTLVITDLWTVPAPSLVTVTALSTVKTTVTTVHLPPITVTTYPETTLTEFRTTTDGLPKTLTTTIWSPSAPYPAGNATTLAGSSSLGATHTVGLPTTSVVVVVSGGAGHVQLSRPSRLACIMTLVAGIMCML